MTHNSGEYPGEKDSNSNPTNRGGDVGMVIITSRHFRRRVLVWYPGKHHVVNETAEQQEYTCRY